VRAMTDPDKSFQLDPSARSFGPSDFSPRQLPRILLGLAIAAALIGGAAALFELFPRDVRIFLGGVAAGCFLSGLLSARSAPCVPAPPLSDHVREIARDPSRKIEAIKAYREETRAGLAEAKQAVEAFINSL
jgi:hypothetical protein